MTSVRRSEQSTPGAAARGRRAGVAWSTACWAGVALFGLVTDAATKAWALSALRGGHQISVPGGILRLQLVANHGAAFGIAAGYESIVAVVSLALIIALGVWAARASTAAERIGAWLAVGGGLGNLLDRLVRPPGGLHGAVTDWIHVSFYGPTFNLADLWLRGGLLIAVIGWLWSRRTRPGRASGQTNETDEDLGEDFPHAGRRSLHELHASRAAGRAARGGRRHGGRGRGGGRSTGSPRWTTGSRWSTSQTAHDPMLEGYSVLSFVAAKTERLRLGLLVTGVTYRHPGLLAKTVTTLDVLSGGRAMLGIGAAWYEREHRALGVPYPPVAERFERLEEAIQICEQMWSDNDGPYEGKHYQLAETICVPRPLQSPRPPILIGGGGEKKTLRLVAKYADACNLFGTSVADVKHKLEVLRGHCDAEGRDYDAITKTIIGRVDPTATSASSCGRWSSTPRSASAWSRSRRRCPTRPGSSPCSARRSSGRWRRSADRRALDIGAAFRSSDRGRDAASARLPPSPSGWSAGPRRPAARRGRRRRPGRSSPAAAGSGRPRPAGRG